MGSRAAATAQRGHLDEAWSEWSRLHAEVLTRTTAPQRVLLETAVRFVAAVEGHAIACRAAAFVLLHAGMGLTPAQVGAAIGRTDRAMRMVQALSARAFLESVWGELGRHRQPKLQPEHAGPIAKYLVEHPGCTQAETVAFIRQAWGLEVDPLTLRRFFKAYGFGVLRQGHDDAEEGDDTDRPIDSDTPASEAPSSCCPRPSR